MFVPALEKVKSTPENNLHLKTQEVAAGGVLGSLLVGGMVLATTVGSIVAAGPILTVLAATGIAASTGGIVGGLITKALIGYGASSDDVVKYIDVIKKGGHLLCVHVADTDRASKALEILQQHHAKDVSLQNYNLDTSNWQNISL